MQPRIIPWTEIENRLREVDLVGQMQAAFLAYSEGRCVIPPVGELCFQEPPGDVHIKYGYVTGGDEYVIKIASGFYQNPKLGLPSSQGLMLLFEQKTGQLRAILLDEGRLTDARTGAAGAVAAKHLAPPEVHTIGIVGTGTQARYQARYLLDVSACRRLQIWGRDRGRAEACRAELESLGFEATCANGLQDLVEGSQLIVTTTPSAEPLIQADWVQPGTHITAVGSDTPDKQELAADLLAGARVIVDSASQCRTRGEAYHALRAGLLKPGGLIELGAVVADKAIGRRMPSDITVADLTGVAVQDLYAAAAVAGVTPA